MSERSAPDRGASVRMTELYASVQGESTHVGQAVCVRPADGVQPALHVVRLCAYLHRRRVALGGRGGGGGGGLRAAHGGGHGGEPLVQRGAFTLLQRLVDAGHEVLLETSGSRPIDEVPDGVHIILDLKPPGSGEVEANLWSNLPLLDGGDEVKFVIASRGDYEWARAVVAEHRLAERCVVLFSPAWGQVSLPAMATWIVEDRLPVRFQVQLHKVVWGADAQGV
jgi:7-carboxy-7-deazaguanine synthase